MENEMVGVGWLIMKNDNSVYVEMRGATPSIFRPDETVNAGHKARIHITSWLGHDNWVLRDMAFLGFRIMEHKDADYDTERPWNMNKDWSDDKAHLVAKELHRIRPVWQAMQEDFNGLLMVDINLEGFDLHIVFGNANGTLGGDVYLSIGDLEEGVIQDETIDTSIDADKESAMVLAGALVGAVESYITYVVPILRGRKEMIVDEPTV